MLTAGTLNNNNGLPDNRINAGLLSGKVSYECHFGLNHANQNELLEKIANPSNLRAALKEMKKKGAPGIDGMSVEALKSWKNEEFEKLGRELLSGEYIPIKGRSARIKKEGGQRQLIIPNVIDRMVQAAIVRQISPIVDPLFADSSYGFRPGRNQHQAINKVSEYIQEGHRHIIDIDLEKFFDKVNQDMIISKLEKTIRDKRVTKLIRKFMIVSSNADSKGNRKGMPQGGPLSPLLSNILLDRLDKELEMRNLKSVRWADDIIVFTRSRIAARRILTSLTKYIINDLKLRMNSEKTKICKPSQLSFLGFKFTRKGKQGISQKSEKKLESKIEHGDFSDPNTQKSNTKKKGWMNYFAPADNTKRMRRCRYKLQKTVGVEH